MELFLLFMILVCLCMAFGPVVLLIVGAVLVFGYCLWAYRYWWKATQSEPSSVSVPKATAIELEAR